MVMQMERVVRLIGAGLFSLTVACTVPESQINLRSEAGEDTVDLNGADLAIGSGQIGAPCRTDGQCTLGKAPKCWTNNILGDPGNLPTAGGYCTSTCTSDTDCGGYGHCLSVQAGAPKYCLRTCYLPNTCRPNEGYACFPFDKYSGYCYPATRLSCNPTAIDSATQNGTCPGANPASACVRRTYEDLGECRPLCNLGVATCAAADGQRQHCVYLDTTVDSKGAPTRDAFRGLACFPLYNDAKNEGADCTYFDECVDGFQCNVVLACDGKCRALCVVGTTDTCPSGRTCRDAFKAGVGKPGLCLPN
jgi:hypothetical protein